MTPDEEGWNIQKLSFMLLNKETVADYKKYETYTKRVTERVGNILEAVGLAGWEQLQRDIMKAIPAEIEEAKPNDTILSN